ncbi:MAG: hypothetical protein WCI12_04045 [Actinomycetes bacterium]
MPSALFALSWSTISLDVLYSTARAALRHSQRPSAFGLLRRLLSGGVPTHWDFMRLRHGMGVTSKQFDPSEQGV